MDDPATGGYQGARAAQHLPLPADLVWMPAEAQAVLECARAEAARPPTPISFTLGLQMSKRGEKRHGPDSRSSRAQDQPKDRDPS